MKCIPLLLAVSSLLTPQAYRTSLFNSLNPTSVAESLAFYELYPETAEGQRALQRAEHLLGGRCPLKGLEEHSNKALHGLLALVNRDQKKEELDLSEKDLCLIERLGRTLANRPLKGYRASCEEEMIALPPHEIDVGRALLLTELGDFGKEHRIYEAMLDLMALQVQATFPPHASYEEMLQALNAFIFEEMRFRFPPHSLYAKDIDLYTFLPSVLDNHLGVCLGVVNLYLCLSQRLGIPLEVITPPGHIYVRYCKKDRVINIETTARGIDIPSETYLSVGLCSLKKRDLKEVIGMTHVNQASVYLHRGEYEKALAAYQKAAPYLPDDLLINELLGFSYLFVGEEEKGKELLQKVAGQVPPETICAESRPVDFLNGDVGLEGIEAIFMEVDETRASILKKQQALRQALIIYPRFREGWIQLAVSYIQLNRAKEALQALEAYHAIDPQNPTVEYYLAVLYGERHDYAHSWEHLKHAEQLTQKKGSYPKALKELKRVLRLASPE